jgi:hypothetical protein
MTDTPSPESTPEPTPEPQTEPSHEGPEGTEPDGA